MGLTDREPRWQADDPVGSVGANDLLPHVDPAIAKAEFAQFLTNSSPQKIQVKYKNTLDRHLQGGKEHLTVPNSAQGHKKTHCTVRSSLRMQCKREGKRVLTEGSRRVRRQQTDG